MSHSVNKQSSSHAHFADMFAQVPEQDIEQFYAHYQLWVLHRRVSLIRDQLELLQLHLSENQLHIDSLHPSALALAVLARLQSKGVSDAQVLDQMLERGEGWLDRMMQRLDYCEQVKDFIQGDYTQWCVNSLEGAYDWIDSLLDSPLTEDEPAHPSTTEASVTPEKLLQKFSQEYDEALAEPTESANYATATDGPYYATRADDLNYAAEDALSYTAQSEAMPSWIEVLLADREGAKQALAEQAITDQPASSEPESSAGNAVEDAPERVPELSAPIEQVENSEAHEVLATQDYVSELSAPVEQTVNTDTILDTQDYVSEPSAPVEQVESTDTVLDRQDHAPELSMPAEFESRDEALDRQDDAPELSASVEFENTGADTVLDSQDDAPELSAPAELESADSVFDSHEHALEFSTPVEQVESTGADSVFDSQDDAPEFSAPAELESTEVDEDLYGQAYSFDLLFPIEQAESPGTDEALASHEPAPEFLFPIEQAESGDALEDTQEHPSEFLFPIEQTESTHADEAAVLQDHAPEASAPTVSDVYSASPASIGQESSAEDALGEVPDHVSELPVAIEFEGGESSEVEAEDSAPAQENAAVVQPIHTEQGSDQSEQVPDVTPPSAEEDQGLALEAESAPATDAAPITSFPPPQEAKRTHTFVVSRPATFLPSPRFLAEPEQEDETPEDETGNAESFPRFFQPPPFGWPARQPEKPATKPGLWQQLLGGQDKK